MSKRKRKHRVQVRQYSRFFPGNRMWWADCTCGDFQGYSHKLDALHWAHRHLAEKAEEK